MNQEDNSAARHLAAIVESSDDAIISKDLDGVITSWNAAAERLYGYTAEEMIGQPVIKLFPPDRLAEEPEILRRIRLGERIEHYETVRQRKDGTLIDISLTVSPILDGHGCVVGASKIARDISGQKRAADILKRQNELLAEIDRRKNEFLAMLGHELRNPLAAIQNACELLESPGEEGEWARGAVCRQTTLLTRLVEDLVDVARITTGRIELRLRQADLSAIIQSAIETTRPVMAERRHHVQIETPASEVVVLGDAVRLEQLLVNLLTNAAKYTDPGGLIRLKCAATATAITVSVRDSGIGICPALLPHIFDLFVQEPRGLDRSRGGLGLGLALSRRLAEMHGGTLAARSAGPGKGSEFTLTLPAPKCTSPLSHPAPPPVQPLVSATPRRILIVDDNRDIAHGLARLLHRRGHAVSVAHDGPSALEEAAASTPDAFLLDLGLPGMDGYELVRELKARGFSDAIFIAVSGYAQKQDIESSRAAGFDHHVAKPVDINLLTGLIDETASARSTALAGK